MFNDEAKINAGITEDRAFRLEDFTYNASSVTDKLYAHLENTDFMGITVSLSMHCIRLRL